MFKMKITRAFVLVGVSIVILGLSGCGSEEEKEPEPVNLSIIGEWTGQDKEYSSLYMATPGITTVKVEETNISFQTNFSQTIGNEKIGTSLEPYIGAVYEYQVNNAYNYEIVGTVNESSDNFNSHASDTFKIDVLEIGGALKVSVTPKNTEAVNAFNNDSYCEMSGWEIDKAKYLSDKCFPIKDFGEKYLKLPSSTIKVYEEGTLCMSYNSPIFRGDYPNDLTGCVTFHRVSSARKTIRW